MIKSEDAGKMIRIIKEKPVVNCPDLCCKHKSGQFIKQAFLLMSAHQS